MTKPMRFNDVLEAVEALSQDEQEALLTLLRRRLAERGRARVASDIRAAEQEFKDGQCRPRTPDEVIDEIMS